MQQSPRESRTLCVTSPCLDRPRAYGARRPRGVVVLQLVVALPLLLIATLAAFEFGFVFLVDQAVETAATQGARVAAEGGSLAQVTAVVNQVLSVYNVDITSSSTDANIVVEQNGSKSSVTSFTCTPSGPALASGEDRVTVALTFRKSSSNSAWLASSIPDWLSVFGFSWGTSQFHSSALALGNQ